MFERSRELNTSVVDTSRPDGLSGPLDETTIYFLSFLDSLNTFKQLLTKGFLPLLIANLTERFCLRFLPQNYKFCGVGASHTETSLAVVFLKIGPQITSGNPEKRVEIDDQLKDILFLFNYLYNRSWKYGTIKPNTPTSKKNAPKGVMKDPTLINIKSPLKVVIPPTT
jgi:hypothetical protein